MQVHKKEGEKPTQTKPFQRQAIGSGQSQVEAEGIG